jgi:hypothetical protein
MKRIFLLSTAVLYISLDTKAQTPEAPVKAIVNYLFTAMKNADPNELVALSFGADDPELSN